MPEPRINDPREVSANQIRAILDSGARPTIQFSSPGATPNLLSSINRLCIEFGELLEVRFYGHYKTPFDAGVVRHLPDVRWLSVDCLTSISGEEHIAQLRNLTKLAFGVYNYDGSEFLASLPLEQLTDLRVNETDRRNLNLAHLLRCKSLRALSITGHTRGIDTIASLPRLEHLQLNSIPKRQGLEFLGRCTTLRSLTILLGGRTSIDDIGHSGLEKLAVLRVRGLQTLGSVKRFPRLKSLHIEDQLQLFTVDLSGAELEEVIVGNCKNLEQLIGLNDLSRLRRLSVFKTSLDLDVLLKREWPATMDVLALYGSSQRWNSAARAELDARGYREFPTAFPSVLH